MLFPREGEPKGEFLGILLPDAGERALKPISYRFFSRPHVQGGLLKQVKKRRENTDIKALRFVFYILTFVGVWLHFIFSRAPLVYVFFPSLHRLNYWDELRRANPL